MKEFDLMDVIVSLPDAVAAQLALDAKEIERQMRLSYALALYRAAKITKQEFGQIAGVETLLEIDAALKTTDRLAVRAEDEVAARVKAWDDWCAMPRPTTPILSDAAMSRESAYADERVGS
jgi:hypothetical protein